MSAEGTTQAAPAIETVKGAGALLREVKEGDKTNPNPKGKAKGKGKAKVKAAKPAEKDAAAKPEAVKPMLNWLKLPAPTLETVKVKDVFRDKRLQHRNQLEDLSEGGAVEQYAEAKKGGKKLPAVKIVRDVSDTPDRGTLWLYDGFQRIGADILNKTKECEAEIIEGTYADALLLSLASNGENSVIPRTKDDARRSVFALLDTPEVLETVLKSGKGKGGAHRTIAKVCDCSTGTVTNALTARELKAKGDQLVKFTPKPEPKAKPTPRPDAALVPPTAPQESSLTATQQRKLDIETYQRLADADYENRLADAKKCAKRLAALYASFVSDPVHGSLVRESMEAYGFGFQAKEFDHRAKKDGKDFSPFHEMLELWPVVDNLCQMTEDAAKRIKAAKDKAQAEADAKEKAAKDAAEKAAEEAAKKAASK